MSISDIINEMKYKTVGYKNVVSRDFRIPGTSFLIEKGDCIYYDKENNRYIIESSKKANKLQGEKNG